MAKKQVVQDELIEESKVDEAPKVEETTYVEPPKVEVTAGHPSRDFKTPLNHG